jgi:hypothetical protein
MQHALEWAGSTVSDCTDGLCLVARAQSAAAELLMHKPRPQPRRCEDFLSGLMDYDGKLGCC